MKKLFYYFLIATLAFNFVGCSDKNKDLDDILDDLEDIYDDDDWDDYDYDEEVEYNGCTYFINPKTKTAILKLGGVLDLTTRKNKYVTGDFVVPQTITYKSNTYTVKEIYIGAFQQNKEVTSLTLHDRIEHIGMYGIPMSDSFKKLIIGKGIKSFDMLWPNKYMTIIYATTPPEFQPEVDMDLTSWFNLIQSYKMKLFVPSESIEAYKTHIWFKYYQIYSIDDLDKYGDEDEDENEGDDEDDEDFHYDEQVDYNGCKYGINLKNNTAILIDGKMLDLTTLTTQYVKGDFVVPQTIIYKSNTYTVTHISSNAFFSNTDLTSLTFHDKIEYIGNTATPMLGSLKKLIIGKGIKSFGLLWPGNYITIIYATTPPELKYIADLTYWFEKIQSENMKLYVPSESIETYKKHVWFKYYDIHSIDELEE